MKSRCGLYIYAPLVTSNNINHYSFKKNITLFIKLQKYTMLLHKENINIFVKKKIINSGESTTLLKKIYRIQEKIESVPQKIYFFFFLKNSKF